MSCFQENLFHSQSTPTKNLLKHNNDFYKLIKQTFALSALTLFVGQQEGHLACQ